MIKLSIIIPYYNTKTEYTDELLDILAPQMTDECECVLVDDGSDVPYKTNHDWCRVIYQKNGGTSVARNTGIDNTTGEYISFIDSDDTVAPYFIEKIFKHIDEEHFDFMEMSWKSLPGGAQYVQKLNSISDHLPNPSVCHRVFKRSFIGDFRFNPNKISGEDGEFSRKIGYDKGKRAVETEFMCFYRTSVPNSKSKRFTAGELPTKKLVYYYSEITNDMEWLYEEVKKEDEHNQVYILADSCDKEMYDKLSYYSKVSVPPITTRGHELRGEYTTYFKQLDVPITAQIVIWTDKTYNMGGIETFIYNFCSQMHREYDIVVLYNQMDKDQIDRLGSLVRVVKNNMKTEIKCDTLIVNRVNDIIPANISYKQSIQMCHACRYKDTIHLPQNRDRIVFVSDTAKESFGEEAEYGEVINNMTVSNSAKDPLILVTASRLDTGEKGQKRMLRLASLLNEAQIPFIWLYFSNTRLNYTPENLIYMKPTLDVKGFIKKADYLVQLSDSESFCYSVVEALELGVPVITTDLPVLKEIGVNNSNAHIIPFDIPDDFDVMPIYEDRKRGFSYKYDNEKRISQWHEVLDNFKAKEYHKVLITRTYNDLVLQQELKKGTEMMMESKRARYIESKGHLQIIA